MASNRLEAEKVLAAHPRPFVIKNPLCSPVSPVHTIVCETVEDTRAWLRQVNYAEGVFLQEYLGRAEAGHIVLVSGGEIHSVVTNQEYKRAFDGNMGIIAGAPLGGLVEKDPGDRYGLARQLIHPLLPWLRKTRFHGPIQVTAVRRNRRWHVIEYNVRIGVTSGPMILRMLKNPVETILATARDQNLGPQFKSGVAFGCSLTLAGYGYPFVQVRGPQVPLDVDGAFDCDVWWNEVARSRMAPSWPPAIALPTSTRWPPPWTKPSPKHTTISAESASLAAITARTSAKASGRQEKCEPPQQTLHRFTGSTIQQFNGSTI